MSKKQELESTLERSIQAYEDMANSPYGIHESIAIAMENKIQRIKDEIDSLNNHVDEDKINIQLMVEELNNTIEVGECFEDRDELNFVLSDLYRIIDELKDYEIKNFGIH